MGEHASFRYAPLRVLPPVLHCWGRVENVQELLRVRAKRLAQSSNPDLARAETLLLESLDIARRRGALSWELRSATTLAELWESQSRREAALELLASVQGRFAEGFATADLVRAASFLEKLRATR